MAFRYVKTAEKTNGGDKMATMICNRADITNLGEAVFYDAASAFLNKNIIVYHNRDLVGLEFDFLLVIPQVGLCVIEVKGWHEQTVIDVQPTGTIVIQGKDHQLKNENPRKQALSYCYVLQNKIASMTGKHPLVFHMVCYPYLSRSFIEHRGFYANDELKLTLSKEDLESAPMLKTKLQTASGLFGARTVDTLDHSLLYHIRRIFEPEYIEEPRNESGEDGMSKSEAVYPYSIVAVMVKSDYNYTSQIDRLVESYAHGTKVFAIFSSEKAAAYALNRLQTTLDSKVLSIDGRHLKMSARPEKLSGNAVMIFNWNSYVTTDASSFSHIRDAWIVDGQCGTEESILLKTLDQMGLFNEQQFLVEHAPIAENILVRAGAGTGKTAVMIDRISYLVYKHQLTAVELADCVLMITFTNDAAENMQDRLKQRFQDYYLLTGKSEYLEMIAGIGHMQISTIHSYAKNIISRLGTTVGYGQKLQIEAGQYNRDTMLANALENYIEEQVKQDPDYISKLGLPIYELRKKLSSFGMSLENKSVDLADISLEQFGECESNPVLHELLIRVIQSAEIEYSAFLADNNRIFLGKLIPALSKVIAVAPERLKVGLNTQTRYMFIDEFQDTDDVQIDVLYKLAKVLNYSLFAVGDVKQCIYRFRGAEEMAFDKLKRMDPSASWNVFHLIHNYRTDRELLVAYARNFEAWGSRGYLAYKANQDSLDNPVKSNGGLALGKYYRKVIIASAEERLPTLFKEIEYLSTRLRAKIRSKIPMTSDERTIAVLVRENWQAQEVVLYGREKEGIMIETAVGGELFSSMPALEMLTLLQTLAIGSLPVLNKFAQSNFIGCELNKEVIYSTGHKGLRYSRTAQIEYITRLIDAQLSSSAQKLGGHSYDSLASIRHALRTMPILQVMHQLYTQLAPWDRYGADDKERSEYYRMNVDALFELLTRNGSIDGITLNSLMAYIGNCVFSRYNQECRYPPKDDKGIRILCTTVHKAKGLEYGYVILPYTSFKIDGFKKSGMDISVLENGNIGYNFNYADGKNIHNTNFNRAEESQERKREETRILYVAMTRAEHGFTWLEESGSRIQASWKALLNMEANP